MTVILEQNPDLIVEAVEPELLILDTSNGKLHRLNSAAGVIWSLMGEGQTPAQLVAQLQKTYKISQETAESDISTMIAEFLALDLVRYKSEEPRIEE